MDKCLSSKVSRGAFTLVELLVVIAIIGILVGLLLPAVQNVRESARRSACASNMRQMAMAMTAHFSTYEKYPPGCHLDTGTSWQAFILPFIEQNVVRDLLPIDFFDSDDFNWSSGDGELALSTAISIFHCPADPAPLHIDSTGIPGRATSSYIGVASGTSDDYLDMELINSQTSTAARNAVQAARSGVLTATQFSRDRSDSVNLPTIITISAIPDGLSNTLVIGETVFDADFHPSIDIDHWAIGSPQIDRRGGVNGGSDGHSQDESEVLGSTAVLLNFYHSSASLSSISTAQARSISFGFAGWHSGNVVNMAFADGTTRPIGASIDPTVFSNLGNRMDGATQLDF